MCVTKKYQIGTFIKILGTYLLHSMLPTPPPLQKMNYRFCTDHVSLRYNILGISIALCATRLRIDNSRQSVFCAIILFSAGISCTISYYMSNNNSSFSLSNNVNDVMITSFFSENINFKTIFPLLFFEHGYLSKYWPPSNTILHRCLYYSY